MSEYTMEQAQALHDLGYELRYMKDLREGDECAMFSKLFSSDPLVFFTANNVEIIDRYEYDGDDDPYSFAFGSRNRGTRRKISPLVKFFARHDSGATLPHSYDGGYSVYVKPGDTKPTETFTIEEAQLLAEGGFFDE